MPTGERVNFADIEGKTIAAVHIAAENLWLMRFADGGWCAIETDDDAVLGDGAPQRRELRALGVLSDAEYAESQRIKELVDKRRRRDAYEKLKAEFEPPTGG